MDPDGELIGLPPIEAYCDMDKNTTEITHNFEKEVNVDHCSTVGCALYVLKYNAPLQQILSLIELSAVCIQDFNYNCFLAPLQDEGINHAWWLDRNGNNCTMDYASLLSEI